MVKSHYKKTYWNIQTPSTKKVSEFLHYIYCIFKSLPSILQKKPATLHSNTIYVYFCIIYDYIFWKLESKSSWV